MKTVSSRPFQRLAVIGALIAALGLAACGRKGSLDLPPGASAEAPPPEQSAGPASPMTSPIGGGSARSSSDGETSDGRWQAPKGPKKKIPLDVLLN